MKDKTKAALLSALILPGVGQLYLGRILKGGLLILATTAMLLATVIALFAAVHGLLNAPKAPGPDFTGLASALAGRVKPSLPWLGGGFGCIWIYGVVDALLGDGKRE